MADGYLETHYAEYEKRKAAWLKKKKHLSVRKPTPPANPQKEEDEALWQCIMHNDLQIPPFTNLQID